MKKGSTGDKILNWVVYGPFLLLWFVLCFQGAPLIVKVLEVGFVLAVLALGWIWGIITSKAFIIFCGIMWFSWMVAKLWSMLERIERLQKETLHRILRLEKDA